MVLQRYPYISEGRSMQQAGQTGMNVGLGLIEGEMKSRYSSQMAEAEVRKLQMEDLLMSKLDAEPDTSKWDSILTEHQTIADKEITKGFSGRALRDTANKLKIDNQTQRNSIHELMRKKDKLDNITNFQTLMDTYRATDARDVIDFVNRMANFEEASLNMYESQDDPRLQTQDQWLNFSDEFQSELLKKFLLKNPDKVDESGAIIEEDYWINHPNEFAREYGIGTNLERDLLNAEEVAKLKREYKTLNSDRIAQTQAENKAMAEAVEIEITNDIIKAGDPKTPKEEKLTYDQIRTKISKAADEGVFVSAEQPRVLANFLDSKTGKTSDDNDPTALAEAYKMMTTDMTQQQKFNKLMSLSSKMKSTTVDNFVKDIYEPETVSNDLYKQYSSAISNLKTARMFSSNRVKNVSLSVKAQNLLKKFAEENPEATEKDYEKFFSRLIENQARWWAIIPGGRPWSVIRRESGELKKSIPMNIAELEEEMKTTKPNILRTATNPETGEKMGWDGTKWIKL